MQKAGHTSGKWGQRLAAIWIICWIGMALFAEILASSRPLKTEDRGEVVYPAFRYWLGMDIPGHWEQTDWKKISSPRTIQTPVPYSPGDLDFEHSGDFGRHKLGTDDLGRDVLSRIIHGAGTALFTGIVSILIALCTGLILGGISGYYGDNQIRVSRAGMILFIPGLLAAWFYGFYVRSPQLGAALSQGSLNFCFELFISFLLGSGILYLCMLPARILKKIPLLRPQHPVWADIWISRLIEIKQSIPALFLILAVAAVTEPSPGMTALLIGFTSWTPIARFVRAELLKTREENYILAARSLGYSDLRILFRHALPNALSPVWALVSFGIAGAILAEASISFIREPADSVSWGSMLSAARKNPYAWWLAVWPGLTLFLTLFSLNIIGERLRDYFDPAHKNKD